MPELKLDLKELNQCDIIEIVMLIVIVKNNNNTIRSYSTVV